MGSRVGKDDADNKKPLSVENISAILAKYDPEGLIKIGAPSDEYDSEAEVIMKTITSGYIYQGVDPKLSICSISIMVNTVFSHSFSYLSKEYDQVTLILIAYDITMLDWSTK